MKNLWIFAFALLFSWSASAEDALDVANAAYKRKDFDTALKILKPLADEGVPRAQYGYGLLLVNGEGISKDSSKGLIFITMAAKAGFAKAQGALAAQQYFETPTPDAYEAAALWAQKAAAQGDALGQTVLGYAYLYGLGLPQNFARARDELEKSVATGSPLGKLQLASIYLTGLGVEVDIPRAEQMLEEAAVLQSFARSARHLRAQKGELLQWRKGNSRLKCDALLCSVAWFSNLINLKKLHDQGSWIELAAFVAQLRYKTDIAYFYLGRASEGIGDFDAAIQYYKFALDPSVRGVACSGVVSCNGLEFPRDIGLRHEAVLGAKREAEAVAMARQERLKSEVASAQFKALKLKEDERRVVFNTQSEKALAGNVDAQYQLAGMYFEGVGTPVDVKQGIQWLIEAANQASSKAQYELGDRYRLGSGVNIDLVKAESLFDKAIKQGHPDSTGGYALLLAEKKQRLGEQVSASVTFNTNTDVLPKGLKGVDVRGVITSLLRTPFPSKTEFETEADYKARVVTWEKRVGAAQNLNGLHAFVRNGFDKAKTDGDSVLEYKGYDIDKQMMSLTTAGDNYYGQIFEDSRSFDGAYVGSNAFGASVRVESWQYTRYTVDSTKGIGYRNLVFPVDKAVAQRISRNLTYVLIGKMVQPYTELSESTRDPKIDNPFKVRERNYKLIVDPIAFWLVDPLTGKVLLKVDVDKAK